MPIFPVLNGSVKTPLRFYSDIRLTSWNCFPCQKEWETELATYAIPSPRNTLPPFQFWRPTSVAVITSWKTFSLDGTQILDLTPAISALIKVPLLDEDRYLYFGNTNLGDLTSVKQYSQITFDDGEIYTSELFFPTCEVGSEDVFLDHSFQTQGAPQWGVGSSSNEADATKNNAGDPADPFPFDGKKTLGLNDALLYTYNAGVWSSSTPSNLNYRFVKSTQQWWQWTTADGWGLMGNPGFDDPPFTISASGVCYTFNNPDGLGLTLDNGQGVDFESIVDVDTAVTVRICLGPWNGAPISVTVGDTTFPLTDNAGGCFVFSATYPAGSTQYIAITPGPAFNGCIQSAEITRSEAATVCNLSLEWENCGDVGTMYYETGFINRFILPVDVKVIRPTVNINTEQTENGRKDQIQDFFRKEVEYQLPVGMVPWHVADALTEIPGHDTIRLTQILGFGSDTIIRVRVVQSWPEGGQDCMQKVDIFFQVDEATVSTACCDEFAPPCDEELDPGTITSMENTEDGYVFQADIAEGYVGQLMVSTDGGLTYEPTDLSLTAEEWADNEIPVDPVQGFYAILVYYDDCELGLTPDVFFACEEGYPYTFHLFANDHDFGFQPTTPTPIVDVTEIWIFPTDLNGVDREAYWLGANEQFFAQSHADPTNIVRFNITGVTTDPLTPPFAYIILEVEYVSGDLPTEDEIFCIGYGHAV